MSADAAPAVDNRQLMRYAAVSLLLLTEHLDPDLRVSIDVGIDADLAVMFFDDSNRATAGLFAERVGLTEPPRVSRTSDGTHYRWTGAYDGHHLRIVWIDPDGVEQ